MRIYGIEAATAESGKEAINRVERHLVTYDVIFMDHMMPEMDGIECLHKIKEQVGGMSRAAKIVALTANAGSENKQLYASAGFDGYMVKPISGEELERECIRLLPKDLVHSIYSDDRIVEESMSWLEEHERKEEIN